MGRRNATTNGTIKVNVSEPRQRSIGSYEVTVAWTPSVGHNKRARRSFPTPEAAALWGAETKLRIHQGLEPEAGERSPHSTAKRTLLDAIAYVYDNHWRHQAAGAKQKAQAEECAEIIGRSKPLDKITTEDMNRVAKVLEERGNCGATVNRKRASVRRAMNEAIILGWISTRPVWRNKKETEGRIARIPRPLEAQVLMWCERLSLHVDVIDFIKWSIHMGSRNSETFALRFCDIHGDKCVFPGEITKNGKSRPVPMPPLIKEIVERRMKDFANAKALMFEGLDKRSFDCQWERIREKLGLMDDPDFVPHAMRHEFCSRLAERGASAAYIMKLSGHLTLAVCQRYVHLFGTESDDMAARFMVDAAPVPNVVSLGG